MQHNHSAQLLAPSEAEGTLEQFKQVSCLDLLSSELWTEDQQISSHKPLSPTLLTQPLLTIVALQRGILGVHVHAFVWAWEFEPLLFLQLKVMKINDVGAEYTLRNTDCRKV